MEEIIKRIRGHRNKVIVEYNNTGQPSKISEEIPPGKTFWDFLQLLIIPLVLLGIGSWFTYQQNQTSLQVSERQHVNDMHIAADQQQETTLKTSMDNIKDLLLNKNLRASKPGDEVRVVARAEVLSALRQLDGERKGTLIQFLSEALLVTTSGNDTIIALRSADLRGADLNGVELSGADLRGADLSGALLNHAGLNGTDLTNADLTGAELKGADLTGADLTHAQVSNEQLAQAKSLKGATMPDGSIHP